MRADEYLRLQAACVAMARQSQVPDVQARWAKLADVVSVSADAVLERKVIYRTDRQATRALERLALRAAQRPHPRA